MSEVRRDIRSRASSVAQPAQRTQIDLDDDDDVVKPATAATPEPTPTARPRRARSAPTIATPAAPAAAEPPPESAPPPKPAKPAARRERRMSIILTDDEAITNLDAASRKLKDNRDQENLKGQLGNTLLLIMGLRLISELDDSELFELARECAKFQ